MNKACYLTSKYAIYTWGDRQLLTLICIVTKTPGRRALRAWVTVTATAATVSHESQSRCWAACSRHWHRLAGFQITVYKPDRPLSLCIGIRGRLGVFKASIWVSGYRTHAETEYNFINDFSHARHPPARRVAYRHGASRIMILLVVWADGARHGPACRRRASLRGEALPA